MLIGRLLQGLPRHGGAEAWQGSGPWVEQGGSEVVEVVRTFVCLEGRRMRYVCIYLENCRVETAVACSKQICGITSFRVVLVSNVLPEQKNSQRVQPTSGVEDDQQVKHAVHSKQQCHGRYGIYTALYTGQTSTAVVMPRRLMHQAG